MSNLDQLNPNDLVQKMVMYLLEKNFIFWQHDERTIVGEHITTSHTIAIIKDADAEPLVVRVRFPQAPRLEFLGNPMPIGAFMSDIKIAFSQFKAQA